MRTQVQTRDSAWRALVAAFAIAAGVIVAVARQAAAADELPPCVECVTVRLEHPVVVRGPSDREPDAPVSVIKLPDGGFRGFSPGGTTIAIDGANPVAALQGPGRRVLTPGPPHSESECGRWLTTVLRGLGALYGLVHTEQNCDAPAGDYKSMAIARSNDYGLTWNVLGPIIATDQSGTVHTLGEGDCTGVDGHNGYWYAYCQRQRDGKNTVARAPIENPGPGKWFKWTGGGWDAPGVGGLGTGLSQYFGTSAAYWTGHNVVLLLGAVSSSLQLSLSEDKVHFGTVRDPIILYDEYNWKRPAPSELYAYAGMVAAERGFNDIAEHFYLTYMYVAPNEDFSQRYLVMQEGWIGAAAYPQTPQVRTALSRWVDADGRTWTTTGPTLSRSHSYSYDKALGYLMTAPPQPDASVKLDECFSTRTGVGFLADAGHCTSAGSERRRPAGYAFRDQAPGTIALFDCVTAGGEPFVSDRRDCENKGRGAVLLGYALRGRLSRNQ
jgi:hypothetical protein